MAPGINTHNRPTNTPDLRPNTIGPWRHYPLYLSLLAIFPPALAILLSGYRIYHLESSLGEPPFFDPLSLFLILGSILFSGIFIYITTDRIFRPLNQLDDTLRKFLKGDFATRAGYASGAVSKLTNSFNDLAEEMNGLYVSLEKAVWKNSTQAALLSEVTQITSSTIPLDETLERTANLIARYFDFSMVSIYLMNETRRYLDMKTASDGFENHRLQQDSRVELDQPSLISWAARYNQTKATFSGAPDGLFRQDDLIPAAGSQAAIPIAAGPEVLGIFYIHASRTDAFDKDTVSILQSLAHLVSLKLQSPYLLYAPSQIKEQEAFLLYKVTRQVAQSQSKEEVFQYLRDSFVQLPLSSAVLIAKKDKLQVLFLTNPKNGQVEKAVPDIQLPDSGCFNELIHQRTLILNGSNGQGEYESIYSLFRKRGSKYLLLVSILEGEKLSGMLAFGSLDLEGMSQPSLQLYLLLADVTSAMLEKFHVITETQERVSALQILNNFSQTISAETDLHHLFHVLHQQVKDMFGPDLEFAVALYDQQNNQIQFPYFYEQGHMIEIPPFPLGEGLTSIVIQSRKPLLLPDERAILSLTGKVVGREPKCWMGIPLLIANEVVGAVLIQDLDHENRFSEVDVDLFNTLAPQIAIAVRNADLFAETQDLLVRHRLLRQVSIDASNSTNLDDALYNIVHGLQPGYPRCRVAIFLLNQEGELEAGVASGYQDKRDFDLLVRQSQSLFSQVALTKQALRVKDAQSDSRFPIISSDMHSALAVPILFGEAILGILTLESPKIGAFTENDQEILSALGSNLAGVISNLRLTSRIRQQIQRERQLFEVTNKIRQSVDLETILATSTREICLAVGAQRARIHINTRKNTPDEPQFRPGGDERPFMQEERP